MNDTYISWKPRAQKAYACNPRQNGSAYYRIQGHKLIIEFSPQGVEGRSYQSCTHDVIEIPTNCHYGIRLQVPQ